MITIEEAGEILDEFAAELPKEFFHELNGGILLLPDRKLHPAHKACDLYIVGEYCNHNTLGRSILIYFGSFEQVYRDLQAEQLRQQLKDVLLHEFTHHLESLAGERGLEIKDAWKIEQYKQGQST